MNTRSLHPTFTLALVAFAVFLGALDLTVVSTILRQVIFDFEIPFPSGLNQAAWIVTGYLLAYTLTMPVMGRLSDLYGRRRVYTASLALFVVGSVIVALSNSLETMIAGRVVQALGAGALVPVAMAIVGDVLPPEKRAVALGIIGAVDTAGWVAGPLYGAWMVTQFEWRWVFWINLPLGIVAGVLAFIALRDLDHATTHARMDYAGATLLCIALASLSLALTGESNSESAFAAASASSSGGLSPYAPAFFALGLVAILGFVWRERRAASPLIDLAMFNDATFRAACAVNLLVGGVLIAAVVDVPLFVNTVMLLARRMTPAQADWHSGVILAMLTTSMMLAAFVGGALTARWSFRVPVLLGLVVTTLGLGLLSRWNASLDNVTQARDLVVCGVGLGIVISPIATAVINTVAEHHRGTASAIVLILRLVGMTIAISVLTTWGVHRFDELSRAAPLGALTAEFVVNISATVMNEIFLIAATISAIALVPALWLKSVRIQT
ncbi:MAG: MFS transporter [Chloroflexi bacterium]|nr:MFS transporter [Chloroflexota bacterium]